MIVVDASILANALGDDAEDGRVARAELRAAGDLTAPDLIDVETVAVLRKRWLAQTISADRFAAAVTDLQDWDFERVPTRRLVRRAYELRANVTAYDATYVALAEALDCELLTADRRVAAAAGPRSTIRVLQAMPGLLERPPRAEVLARIDELPGRDYRGETAAESTRATRDAG